MCAQLSDPRRTPGLLQRLAEPPRTVTLLRASRIGDFICAGPAFRALRAALPAAHITLITLPLLQELARRLPWFDAVAAFPGYPGIAEQLFDARAASAFLGAMQKRRFDLAVQLQGSGVHSNPFTLMLGARYTAGFVRPGDGPGRLDAALPLPDTGHEIERVLALPLFLGAARRDAAPLFPVTAADREGAARMLRGLPRPLIGLHAGSRETARRWPARRFVETAVALRRRCGGTVVLLGGAQERAPARRLAAAIGAPCRDLSGRVPLVMLGAVIGELALLIASDSGPAHVAYAVGTPTVTVMRSGGRERYGPPDNGPFLALEPAPDSQPPADGHRRLVSVAQVLEAAELLLAAPPQPRTGAAS